MIFEGMPSVGERLQWYKAHTRFLEPPSWNIWTPQHQSESYQWSQAHKGELNVLCNHQRVRSLRLYACLPGCNLGRKLLPDSHHRALLPCNQRGLNIFHIPSLVGRKALVLSIHLRKFCHLYSGEQNFWFCSYDHVCIEWVFTMD